MTEEFRNLLIKELKEIELELSEDQIRSFYEYYQILIEWNQVMNLTAITEWREVITKHFVDSLSLIKVVPDIREKDYRVIDVGTGAGFPGIPLKIVFPEIKVTLLDSLNKRVKFLNQVIISLTLSSVETIHGRAEDIGRDSRYREQYDLCVSRAVANISTLSEYCMPFVRKGGYFIPYKSGKIEEELAGGKGAVRKLGGIIEDIVSFTLPNSDERSLVKIKKQESINKKYPRKAGLPSKEPLS